MTKYEEQKRKEEERQEVAIAELDSLDLGCDNEASGTSLKRKAEDSDYSLPESRAKHAREIPALLMPKDILTRKKVSEAFIRANVLPENAVNILAAIIAESDGDMRY